MGSSSSIPSSFVVVAGNLSQTVAKGSLMETVTISNVNSFSRLSWNLSSYGSLNVENSGTTVTISGKVETWASVGKVTETLVINGDTVYFNMSIVEEGTEISSSSAENSSSSSDGSTEIVMLPSMSSLSVALVGRSLEIASADPVNVEIFDMQGRLLKRIPQVNGLVSLASLRQGSYIVRVRSLSSNWTRRISIR